MPPRFYRSSVLRPPPLSSYLGTTPSLPCFVEPLTSSPCLSPADRRIVRENLAKAQPLYTPPKPRPAVCPATPLRDTKLTPRSFRAMIACSPVVDRALTLV